jgi:murein DD-endopeptidase MepM/ murein hydrolase activator NlpD
VKERVPPELGDTTEKDLRWAGLNYRQGLVERVTTEARVLQSTIAAACRRWGRKVVLRGKVLKMDDAHGLLTLVGGRVVKLPRGRHGNGIGIGVGVEIVAHGGGGGPFLGDSVVADASQADFAKLPCVTLLIAPAQDFTKTPAILHNSNGYRANSVLWLEEGMRVAATKKCAHAKPNNYYSLAIEASSSTEPAFTVAAALGAGSPPVPLGIDGSDVTWTLKVTERRQGTNCPPGGPMPAPPVLRHSAAVAKSYPCPVIVLGTTTYTVKVYAAASYASAVYDQTIFDLDTHEFGEAKVIGLVSVHQSVPNPSFEAEGYWSFHGVISKIPPNSSFGVFPEAWYGFPHASPLDAIGVDHYAGLVWPRIVGTRNGKPYRYRARLPEIVTDLPPNCAAADCFYRLPWAFGTTAKTLQGNGPNAPSHTGKQQYAFDFVMDDGDTIYATRGGVVGDVVEGLSTNYNPCDPATPNADGPANFVRIDHQDGRFSYYAHVRKNSVIPNEGDAVERGDAIALVGNTGRSCGPHLHYQVAIDGTDTIYGQTTAICFETDEFFCYLPKTNNSLVSTNG